MVRDSYRYQNVDFAGKRHERLVAIRKANSGRTRWICKCDCGKEIVLTAHQFLTHKSCGCLEKENLNIIKTSALTHGMTNTRLYKTWCGIKGRCNNPNAPHYDRYGGRGIKMCDEWQNNFQSFADWAIANDFNFNSTGEEQSIDRIDPNGNYEPSNCRWVTKLEQARNRSDSVFVNYNGERLPLAVYVQTTGVEKTYAFRGTKNGMSGEDILHDWNLLHNSVEYMDAKEAAKAYGVCYGSIQKWIHKGKIPHIRARRKFLIPRDYVEHDIAISKTGVEESDGVHEQPN